MRRIAAQLEMRPPAEARKLAAFAYILGRAANADYGVSDEERAEIATLVAEVGGVPAADAALVAELAGTLSWTDGATEDFLVAREYREISSPEERLALLRCCLLVVGIDDAIGAEEAWLINRIAEELDVPRPDVNHVRLEFMDRYTAIKDIRRDNAG
ncbi:MAG: TerB family tellurite resistance protein [Chloroflexota bacterium]